MAAKDLETGVEGITPSARKSPDGVVSQADVDTAGYAGDDAQSVSSPPVVRLVAFVRKIWSEAILDVKGMYPPVLEALRRTGRLVSLSLMLIFVVMLASFFMALSHWFTIVFGHLVLRYILPPSIDDTFVRCRLDQTMIMAGVGAFVVNLAPFIIFLLSFPLTFDRTVLEGSTAPANEFIKRITPTNRYALIFMKYAPRLAAGPIGCAIFILLSGEDYSSQESLDPLHAAIAGVGGEVTLTTLAFLKTRFSQRRRRTDPDMTQPGKSGEEVLPLARTT
ncbi:hypothetical protein BV20DRAFT_960855 [Pilatotrama ljubarskyi]|nr:hypothetical protein BV20DRAFT_960855 [Pilatotrama ljubarskyi]